VHVQARVASILLTRHLVGSLSHVGSGSLDTVLLPVELHALVFDVEGLVPTLSINLLHVNQSLTLKLVLDVLHVTELGTSHNLIGDLGVFLEDLNSKETFAEGDGLNIGCSKVDEL
jgi:hypothetical protein